MTQNSIATSFASKKRAYTSYAKAQKSAATTLEKMVLPYIKESLWPIVDIGSGPSPLFKTSNLPLLSLDISENAMVQGDMDALPFKQKSVQGVLSSSAFQWSVDIESLFQEIHRVLLPNGIVGFSLFIEGTLSPLQKIQQKYKYTTGVQFIALQKLEEILLKQGFIIELQKTYDYSETFPTAIEALKSISLIGAAPVLSKPLLPTTLKHFIHDYTEMFHPSNITHTYVIHTAILRKCSL